MIWQNEMCVSLSHLVLLLLHVQPVRLRPEVPVCREVDGLLPQTLLNGPLLLEDQEPEVGHPDALRLGLGLGSALGADANLGYFAELN